MGLISGVMGLLFGQSRNVIVETAGAFRENAEAAAIRDARNTQAAMAQFSGEFQARRGWFDQLIDGLNRLPRPMLAYGTVGLFVMAMRDPEWFAARMQGIALVPEPLWWLMGAIVSFYFGARHQAHAQAFQRSVAESLSRLPQVRAAQAELAPPVAEDIAPAPPEAAARPRLRVRSAARGEAPARYVTGPNAALDQWFALN